MPPRVGESVAVITGASSGIARATAVAFAERGARLVLAARSEQSLDDVVRECVSAGGRAIAVPIDVGDEEAVQRLARRAHDEFGRIDIWVNAAAVMTYGRFEDTPTDVFRRVIETNLMGQIHGARAVLPYFRECGHGVLVNVASVWGSVTSPYVIPYVVSKFGVRAFSECLQEGLRIDPEDHDIHVCTILPQSVDTPIFRHAGNFTEHTARPVPPVVDPARVVHAIVRSVEHPRRQRTVGWFGRLLEVGHGVVPGFYSRLVPTVMNKAAFSSDPATPNPGNVFEPMPDWNKVEGEWRRPDIRAAVGAAAGGLVAAGVGVAAWRRSHG